MEWYHYFSGFWAGMFLANFVPHFVSGAMGNRFPSPFAKPPGKGLSSPTLNIIWALFNLVLGYILFRAGKVSSDNTLSLIIFLAGITCMSIYLSKRFSTKDKE
ncbi:MAG: hypothetical protein JWP12_3188 [Bacteroidetes bacterium]|nr:hypothetical protein [Bacteroidota bacterium]